MNCNRCCQIINNNCDNITKNFILTNKNINFNAERDQITGLFFVNIRTIYNSGTVKLETMKMTDCEINKFFCQVEKDTWKQ